MTNFSLREIRKFKRSAKCKQQWQYCLDGLSTLEEYTTWFWLEMNRNKFNS